MKNHKTVINQIALLGMGAGMLWLHVKGAPGFHLPDYDTHRYAWNAQQLAAGHFNELFHHLAPLYQLILAATWRLFARVEAWVVLGAVVYATTCVYWCKQLTNTLWQQAGLLLLLQLTPLLFYHNGGLQTTPFYILAFVVWWLFYKRRPETSMPTLPEVFWWSVCIVLEYKSIFWLSGLWLYDGLRLIRHKVPLRHWMLYLRRAMGILCLPALLAGIGTLSGIPWWRYPAAWLSLFLRKEYLQQGSFDAFFHFKYLFHYEPVAFAGLLISLFFLSEKKRDTPQRHMEVVYFIALWLVVLMTFLPKAPRGILLSVFVGYTAFVQGIERLPSLALAYRKVLVSLGLVVALWVSAQRLLPYATYVPPYEEAARRLSPYIQTKAEVHSLLCLAPALYLPPDVPFRVHFTQALDRRPLLVSDAALLFYNEKELQALRKRAAWVLPHPFLGFPLLHLESAEFQGHSYKEALAFARRLQQHEAAVYFLPH